MSEYRNPEPETKFKNDAPNFTWSEVWTMVLSKPSTETFETVLRDPQASRQRAFNWMFITGTIAVILQQIVISMLPVYSRAYGSSGLMTVVCGLVLGGAMVVLFFALSYGLMQFIAQSLGGTGSYGEFYYASAAFAAPLMMVNVALTPFASSGSTAFALVSLALSLYQLALTGMALRAVNQFGWGKAIGSIVLYIIVAVVIFIALFSCVLGPMISNAYR
jgi:hypothetical protein